MGQGCAIAAVGKRRDGKMRYWCTAHGSNATGPKGVRLDRCGRSDVPPIPSKQVLKLDPAAYRGGIAIWGAVPAVYSTASHDLEELGVHVHARRKSGDEKHIDYTFKKVVAEIKGSDGSKRQVEISEEEAIYYMTSSVFGHEMKYVECTHCRRPHLDKDWFSVHRHRKHLCASCGRTFQDTSPGIGNPLMGLKQFCGDKQINRKTTLAKRKLDVSQRDFPQGIELWGSNEAILWTSSRNEEHGVHFHGYTDNVYMPSVDDTFEPAFIDGVRIDSRQLGILMAQSALPHLQGRIEALECPRCETPHFDVGEFAYTPHRVHECACGIEFENRGRTKNVISNPMVQSLRLLEVKAVRPRRTISLNLSPEI